MPIFWKKDYKKYNKLSDFYFGDMPIKKAYYGSTLVYDSNSHFGEVLFNTQGLHEFIVPRGHKFIDVEVCASQGRSSSAGGGGGGLVTCRIKVTPKQKLYCYVGFVPSNGRIAEYNASDIRLSWDSVTGDSLNNRIVTAGGGGNGGTLGSGGYYRGAGGGGAGGYPNGDNGRTVNPKGGYAAYGGGGATQFSFGGGGGTAGHNYGSGGSGAGGSFGIGGNGGPVSSRGGYGGAGGAGWYGGGGGGTAIHNDSEDDKWYMDGGGGAGSSYADNQYCSYVVYTGNYRVGNGYIKIKEVIS